MLKLNYTESGLHLEWLSISVEALLLQRLTLALRIERSLYVESGKAAFLLPADVSGLAQLKQVLETEPDFALEIFTVDAEFVEVSLQGSWIAENAEAHEGTFITVMSDRLEFLVYKLWQATHQPVSFLV